MRTVSICCSICGEQTDLVHGLVFVQCPYYLVHAMSSEILSSPVRGAQKEERLYVQQANDSVRLPLFRTWKKLQSGREKLLCLSDVRVRSRRSICQDLTYIEIELFCTSQWQQNVRKKIYTRSL